jgi:hypothetical protein
VEQVLSQWVLLGGQAVALLMTDRQAALASLGKVIMGALMLLALSTLVVVVVVRLPQAAAVVVTLIFRFAATAAQGLHLLFPEQALYMQAAVAAVLNILV